MKKNLLQSFAVISIFGGLIFWGSFARAWTYPTTVPPAGNVVTPINTGIVDQTKKGNLFNKDAFISPWGFFSRISLPGIITSSGYLHPNLTIGGSGSSGVNLSTSNMFISGNFPLAIDLKNRPTSNALEIYSDQSAVCPINKKVTFVADTAPAFQLWNASKNQNADLIARQVQLTGGSPGAGKVLTSDNEGNASWGTVNASGLNHTVGADIKQIVGIRSAQGDSDSYTISCPADYAAISVVCDVTRRGSSNDANADDHGTDTCAFDDIPGSFATDSINTASLSSAGSNYFPKSATVSPSGDFLQDGDVTLEIWLTCMRYQNFQPVTNIISPGTSPVATGQLCQ